MKWFDLLYFCKVFLMCIHVCKTSKVFGLSDIYNWKTELKHPRTHSVQERSLWQLPWFAEDKGISLLPSATPDDIETSAISYCFQLVLFTHYDKGGNIVSCKISKRKSEDDEIEEVVNTWKKNAKETHKCESVHQFLQILKTCLEKEVEQKLTTWSWRPLLSTILPGTLWCGKSDTAKFLGQLGVDSKVDKCCRLHDFCPLQIYPFSSYKSVLNSAPVVMSHCDCDRVFYKCLHDIGSISSRVVSYTYFSFWYTQYCVPQQYLDGTYAEPEVKRNPFLHILNHIKDEYQELPTQEAAKMSNDPLSSTENGVYALMFGFSINPVREGSKKGAKGQPNAINNKTDASESAKAVGEISNFSTSIKGTTVSSESLSLPHDSWVTQFLQTSTGRDSHVGTEGFIRPLTVVEIDEYSHENSSISYGTLNSVDIVNSEGSTLPYSESVLVYLNCSNDDLKREEIETHRCYSTKTKLVYGNEHIPASHDEESTGTSLISKFAGTLMKYVNNSGNKNVRDDYSIVVTRLFKPLGAALPLNVVLTNEDLYLIPNFHYHQPSSRQGYSFSTILLQKNGSEYDAFDSTLEGSGE